MCLGTQGAWGQHEDPWVWEGVRGCESLHGGARGTHLQGCGFWPQLSDIHACAFTVCMREARLPGVWCHKVICEL